MEMRYYFLIFIILLGLMWFEVYTLVNTENNCSPLGNVTAAYLDLDVICHLEEDGMDVLPWNKKD